MKLMLPPPFAIQPSRAAGAERFRSERRDRIRQGGIMYRRAGRMRRQPHAASLP